ncbi:lipoprotein [Spiroplasma sp. DGKH1]|uniref:lipoprotein n=1 Tax=Spiroplasma sp. DGKH1 TaxID=3050074 RepID=UPI0034C60F6D
MKKILGLIGAITFITTGTTNVISCNNHETSNNLINLEDVLTVTDLGKIPTITPDDILIYIKAKNPKVVITEIFVSLDSGIKEFARVHVKGNSKIYHQLTTGNEIIVLFQQG